MTSEVIHRGLACYRSRRQFLLGTGAVSLAAMLSCGDAGPGFEAVSERRVTAHDGSPILVNIYGRGRRYLLMGPGTWLPRPYPSVVDERAAKWLDLQVEAFLACFADRYCLIFTDYPTAQLTRADENPDRANAFTLTPDNVAHDLLAIADGVRSSRFAYFGYSWGASVGVQLAIRTDRLTALICGGFPMIDAPYGEFLQYTSNLESEARRVQSESSVPAARRRLIPSATFRHQFVTYYQALQEFDDRAVQSQLTCPRLCFVGSEDGAHNGTSGANIEIGPTVISHRTELEKCGWSVEVIEGKDHDAAGRADVNAPLVARWLDGTLKVKSS